MDQFKCVVVLEDVVCGAVKLYSVRNVDGVDDNRNICYYNVIKFNSKMNFLHNGTN